MLKPIFTLDYEIHGNGDGSPDQLMVEPTRRMLDQFDRYGAKLTILADIGEILQFKRYAEERGRDDYHYGPISAQLQDAVRRGHDVQLHIHSSYFNARHEDGRWIQDWSEYSFADLPLDRAREMIRVGKEFLETLLQPVDPAYRCFVFRAANWSMNPSRNATRALAENGFTIETSVFKYGRRSGLVNFDYSHAPSSVVPWRASEDDVCRPDPAGKLVEFPIYSENRWIGAFLSVNRFYRALQRKSEGAAQDFPYMPLVVLDAGEPLDQRCHAGQRPQCARKSVLLRVFQERGANARQLTVIEPRLAARPPGGAKRVRTAFLRCHQPAMHAGLLDAKLARNLGLAQPSRVQHQRPMAPAFHCLEITRGRSCPLHAEYYTILCETQ